MKQSLRRALAVRFAATLAVGLAATSVAICWGASRVLRHQLDQAIAAAAFLVANELQADAPVVERPLPLNASRYRREINRYVVLRDPQGRPVRAVPGWAMDLPADPAALTAARAGAHSYSDARWHDMPMRSVYVAVWAKDGPGDRVVQVAASLDQVQTLQRWMLAGLAGIVLLGSAATLVGAWRLAGSAVQPVEEITQQATHIEAGTLDQRISAHATTDEYRGLVAVLNRMLDRLASAFASQRRFTTDVSHELRSPLTALRGEIEVALRADRSPREYQRVLHSALEEIGRLTTMSEELLLISRADARLITPQRVPTDVNAVVEAALERLRHRILEKELSVERTMDAGDGVAPVDLSLVTRLVDELLDNAVNYSGQGGRLTIRTERRPGAFRLVVEDTGPGIPPADLAHLFEPYYRADQARTRGAGTGLGLTTAAAIARLHGGTIRAANRDAGGARFEVDFPTTPHKT